MNRLVTFCAGGVLAACAAMAAEPPPLDIPPGARQSGMLQEQKDAIAKRVGYWVGKLADARSAEDVLAARKGLVADYFRYGPDAQEYLYTCADATDAAGRKFLASRAAGDPLRSLKEVNLAMAAARMAQVPIQPLLEAMVAGGNAGVRYFAWQGYRQVRPRVLAQGMLPAKMMLDAMRKAAAGETDGLVVAELMDAMALPAAPEAGVPPGTYRTAQEEAFSILRATWNRLCRELLSGEAAMADGCLRGLGAIQALGEGLGNPDDVRKAAMQMVLNAAYCASVSYDRAEQLGAAARVAEEAAALAARVAAGQADDALKEEADRRSEAAAKLAEKLGVEPRALTGMGPQAAMALSADSLLLRDCEAALNRLSGKTAASKPAAWIRKPLESAAGLERGAAVRLGVLKWVDELVREGLTPPKNVFATATAPS